MIEKDTQIKELYELKHMNDKIESGFDYEENLIKNSFSNVITLCLNLGSSSFPYLDKYPVSITSNNSFLSSSPKKYAPGPDILIPPYR
jgi:hypothetical protein